MNQTKHVLLLAVLASAVGCSNRLAFVTQTSIGLDVSGTVQYPNKVSVSYNRQEVAIVPRKTDGTDEGHSVFGGLNADMKFALPPQYDIRQVFATGDAAVLAAEKWAGEPPPAKSTVGTGGASEQQPGGKGSDNPNPATNSKAPLVFFTGTAFGIQLNLGEQEMSPNALLGYRRTEATVIPIPDSSKEVRSVYADVRIASGVIATVGKDGVGSLNKKDGIHIKQAFATGRAAVALAKKTNIQNKLAEAAGVSSVSDCEKKAKSERAIHDHLV